MRPVRLRSGVDHFDHGHVLVAVERYPPEDARLVPVDRFGTGLGEVAVVSVELQHHAAEFRVLLGTDALGGQCAQLREEAGGYGHTAPGVQGEAVAIGERGAVTAVQSARLVAVEHLGAVADDHRALVGPPPARVPRHCRESVEPVAPAVEGGEPGRVVLAQDRVEQNQPDIRLVLGLHGEVGHDPRPYAVGERGRGLPELGAGGGPQGGPAGGAQLVVHPAPFLRPGPGPYVVTDRAPRVGQFLHRLDSGPWRIRPHELRRVGQARAAVGEPHPLLGRCPVRRAGRRRHGPP